MTIMRSTFYTSLAAAAIFASAVSGQNSSSSVPTINLFIDDGLDGNAEYAASIVTAYSDQTVYALHCTSGPASVGSTVCGPNAQVRSHQTLPGLRGPFPPNDGTNNPPNTEQINTVTEGSSTYGVSSTITTKVQGHTAVAAISAACGLDVSTASCVEYVSISVDGSSTKTTTTRLLTGTDYHRFDVAITGGAEKTAQATAASTDSKSGAVSLSLRGGMTMGALLAAGVTVLLTM